MPLSSAERFRIYKAKLKLEANKSLLQTFRQKDAEYHRKHRQLIKQNPDKMENIRAQNRARQAKRRQKLALEKITSKFSKSCELASTVPCKSWYKSVQSFSKAIHRSERGLPKSPTKKKEIIKHLAIKHGIMENLSTQMKLNVITEATKQNVIEFYHLNEISSVAPGKKDVITIKLSDGTKKKVQKRYLIMNVKEVYVQFKLAYPDEKIGLTSFTLLRPDYILPMSDIPQNVCLCKYHTNIELLLSSLYPILNTPKFTSVFREALVCDSNNEECMSSICNYCGNLTHFDEVFQYDDTTATKEINYFQWESIDSRIVKVEKTATVKNTINELKSQTSNFLMHSFITHAQHVHFEECRENASSTSLVLQVDFSENYRTTFQDEIQSAYFNYRQIGLFNGVVWCGIDAEPINYSLASDDVSHDKYSIHTFLTTIIEDLKHRFPGHGRGAVDGVGGTIKRLAWRGVMSNKCIIHNAEEFVHYLTAVAEGINIFLIKTEEIKSKSLLLDQRWDKIRSIPNTLKIHYVKPLSLYNVEVKSFSKSNDTKTFCLKS